MNLTTRHFSTSPFTRLSISFGIVILSLLTNESAGQEWAKKMFVKLDHDFGVVAKGSDAVYKFELQNVYEEDVHIASVQTTCRCTIPTIEKSTLKTWEKSSIIATFNTKAFTGNRSATITVRIDKPFPAEIQLNVKGNIRGDVLIEPGQVNFGSTNLDQTITKKIKITRFGNRRWKIVDVLSLNKHLSVGLSEISRFQNRVEYEMSVDLKETAPSGEFKSDLILVTNDQNSKKLTISVAGNVLAPITISPDKLRFGTVKLNSESSRRIYVRGTKPFELISVDCENSLVTIQAKQIKPTIALITVALKTGGDSILLDEKIKIVTSLDEEPMIVPLDAEISER